jgi:Golgi phosphoprotein 3 (GPP34)
MLLAEDLLLLLMDDKKGKPLVGSTGLDLALAGALLAELTAMRRVDVAGPDERVKAGRLVVRNPEPTGDPILDEALRLVAGAGGKKPGLVIPKMARGVRRVLLQRLVDRGVLRRRRRWVLVFPVRRWPAVDPAYEQQVWRGLWEVLVAGRAPTSREGSLIALLHAIRAVPTVMHGCKVPGRKLRRRAEQITSGGFADEAVRQAVAAVNTTMLLMMQQQAASNAALSGLIGH